MNCINNINQNMNNMTACCPKPNMPTREEMLRKIKCYKFAINDLTLYLDTHTDDMQAICLHKKYCNELKEWCDRYQRIYGPLTSEFPCNKWRWIEEPWPWEGENV